MKQSAYLMRLGLGLVIVSAARLALAGSGAVDLLAKQGDRFELPYGEQKTLEFVCPWNSGKIPTVLDFTARIDTPGHEASSGGPLPLLIIELNGAPVGATAGRNRPRLLNKPPTSTRDLTTAEVVWFAEPSWALLYCGSWEPPTNQYLPHTGSPVRFVLDVSDLLKANATNKLTLTYLKVMADDPASGPVPLAEFCAKTGFGDATVLFGILRLRPRDEKTDAPPQE